MDSEWRLVPVEPTEAMIRAWADTGPGCNLMDMSDEEANAACACADWSAMLSAAPPAEREAGDRKAWRREAFEEAARIVVAYVRACNDRRVQPLFSEVVPMIRHLAAPTKGEVE